MTAPAAAPSDRGGLLLSHVWFPAPRGVPQREGWDRCLERLANTAQPEAWDDPTEPTGKLPVLSNFLRYSYARLHDEDDGRKLVEGVDDRGGRIAAFNTGLFTPNFEPIVCLMQAHRDPSRDQWVFQDWVRPTDWRLRGVNHDDLEPAQFFKDGADLLLRPDAEIVPNIEHILERMPERAFEVLPDDELQRRIMLQGAAEEAKKRAQMNWRVAVPQFYWPGGREDGRIQLLLPLRLRSNHAADLALAVEREGERRYVGYTVLTVGMAYKNARLLSRPESDWLWTPPISLPDVDSAELDDQSAPKWRRVSSGDRCPICGEPTRCVMAADNKVAMCFREADGGSPIQTSGGEIVWEHTLVGRTS